MPRTERLWTKLDIGYFGNPKVVEALYADGGEGTRAHALVMHLASICHARQHATNGYVSERAITRQMGGTPEDADLLVEVGLWHRRGHGCPDCPDDIPEGKVYVHDFLEFNPDAAELEEKKQARKEVRTEKARKAAHARWNAQSMPQASTEHDSDAQAMPQASPSTDSDAQPMLANAIKTRQDKTRQETREASASAVSDFDAFWAAYPRKEGKLAAKKAYAKALTLTTHERILYAVKAYSERVNPNYIAHPTTWLNQGRWDDEPIIEAKAHQRPWAYQPIPEQTPEQQRANQEWLEQMRQQQMAGREQEEYFEAEQLPGFDWQGAAGES